MAESTLSAEKQKYSNSLAEFEELEQELNNLLDGRLVVNVPPEVEALRTENSKLRYRINMLKRNIIAEEGKDNRKRKQNSPCPASRAESPREILTRLFEDAVAAAFPRFATSIEVPVLPSSNERFGDYQCNVAMALSQAMKKQGEKCSPQDIGRSIMDNLPPNDVIEKTELAGPGFVNITLKRSFVERSLCDLVKSGVRPPLVDRTLRVVVDFSSPNIAKQMHVGHLRSTIIGDSICRLLEFVGHDVLRLNHIGDWGTQFGMLIAHLQDKFPDYKSSSPPIGDLQAFYKESKLRFDSDEEFKKRAYACVVKLQARDPDIIRAWTLICDVSRKEFKQLYDRLDVKLVERGESFYQEMMQEVVDDLKSKGELVEDEGRLVMFADGCSIPLTVVKSDGGFTYDTSDLTALRHRVQHEKADWIIYVVDAGQALHFETVFKCAQKVGYTTPTVHRVDHVAFGLVLGEDKKKFKTRSGDTVKLSDLLDEGVQRSLQKLKEKGRDKVLSGDELVRAQEAVAYGCIKYADLCHSRQHDYIFSFDRMLDDRGNTAVYLLYALTRIRSIARNANVDVKSLREKCDAYISLEHPKEWKLGKALLRFPEVITLAMNDLVLHPICEYLYDLSQTFSEFYDACYCIEKNKETGEIIKVNEGRLALCEATSSVMQEALRILGIKTVEKM